MSTYLLKVNELTKDQILKALKHHFSLTLKDLEANPDILLIKDFDIINDTITLEDVKDVTHFTRLKPLKHSKKFVIILGFEYATLEVQNKLLKILEEHPKYLDFILIVQNTNKLLETVMSRAITLDFGDPPQAVSIESLSELLKNWNELNVIDVITNLARILDSYLKAQKITPQAHAQAKTQLTKAQEYINLNLSSHDVKNYLYMLIYDLKDNE